VEVVTQTWGMEDRLGRARVLVVEDHGLVAEAFAALLEPEFAVVGTVGDGESLVRAVRESKPDVVLLDLYLPGVGGLDAGPELKARFPGVKIVVVTVDDNGKTADEALKSWASGYVLKRSMGLELPKAIRAVLRGERYVTPALENALMEARYARLGKKTATPLTARQREVLQLLGQGCTMKEAAAILKVTARTVAFHKYRIMKEFGVKTNTELMQFAMKQRAAGAN
jgi:DNA-binding NarL/FixJ family response regulator